MGRLHSEVFKREAVLEKHSLTLSYELADWPLGRGCISLCHAFVAHKIRLICKPSTWPSLARRWP